MKSIANKNKIIPLVESNIQLQVVILFYILQAFFFHPFFFVEILSIYEELLVTLNYAAQPNKLDNTDSLL